MIRVFIILLLLTPTCFAVDASTFTTNFNLEKPSVGSRSWSDAMSSDMDIIDAIMAIGVLSQDLDSVCEEGATTDVDITISATASIDDAIIINKIVADSVALKPTATVTVASSTSLGKDTADYTCDGTDDQVQINAAIQDVINPRGGKVQLLEGIFSISAPITIDRIGIFLEGASSEGTEIFLANNSDCDMIQIDVDSEEEWFTLENMKLDGNKDNQASGRGLYDSAGASEIRDVHIRNVFFSDIKGNGIELENSWGLILDGVTIEFCGGHGVVLNNNIRDAKIVNCKIIENDGSAIYINGPSHAKIAGNFLTGGANNYAVYLGSGIFNLVQGNIIRDSGGVDNEGIYITGDNNLIVDNIIHLKTDMDFGIHLVSGADNNQIYNNYIFDEVGTPIFDEGANNLIVWSEKATDILTIKGDQTVEGNFTIGANDDVNHTLTFDADSNDGIFTYDEDNDILEWTGELKLFPLGGKLTFNDSGNAITMTPISSTLVFDGDDKVAIANTLETSLTTTDASSIYIKLFNNAAGSRGTMFASTSDDNNILALETNSNEIICGIFDGGSYAKISGTFASGVREIIYSYDGAGTSTLYIDGATQSGTSQPLASSTIGTLLGAKTNSTQFWTGKMYDCRVWSKVLDATDRTNVFAGNPVTDSLIAHWDFHEGTGVNLEDIVGAFEGTITNGVWEEASEDDTLLIHWDKSGSDIKLKMGIVGEEDLTFDFNTTDNQVDIGSTTGVTDLNFGIINLTTIGNMSSDTASFDTATIKELFTNSVELGLGVMLMSDDSGQLIEIGRASGDQDITFIKLFNSNGTPIYIFPDTAGTGLNVQTASP